MWAAQCGCRGDLWTTTCVARVGKLFLYNAMSAWARMWMDVPRGELSVNLQVVSSNMSSRCGLAAAHAGLIGSFGLPFHGVGVDANGKFS